MGLYKEHYDKISTFKYNFEKVLETLKNESDFDKKLRLALYAAKYFVYNNTGYFTSSILESFFVDYAKKIRVDISGICYEKNSVLHILTEGYQTGGHTRVVERWIENAPIEQKHSVLFTSKNNAKLNTLKNNVKNKNGKYITLDEELSLEEIVKKVRKIAMEYEYVVLHTHQDDPVPTLAFGVNDFSRPVFLYNHSSHMAWIGKSIADLVLDIENEDEVTKIKRGISNTFFLGVPSKNSSITSSEKISARQKLNLPFDKKIIVTSGGDARYRIICGNSFIDYLKEIIDNDSYCYVIGVSKNNPDWNQIKRKTNYRVKTLGSIPFDKGYLDYLKAADLYLDSYPLCGGTATIDAITAGVPVVSLKSVYPQFDYLTNTSAYCKTKDEFIEKAKKILSDKQYANEIYHEVQSSLIKYQSIDSWNKRLSNLFENAPKEHKVKDLSGVNDYCENNDLSVLCNVIVNKKFLKTKKVHKFTDSNIEDIANNGCLYKKQGIPFFFQILSYKKSFAKKEKTLVILGIKIKLKTK